jgi:membrane protease YdiL (CAAX protease family)
MRFVRDDGNQAVMKQWCGLRKMVGQSTERKITVQSIALLALLVYICEETVSSLVFLSMNRYPVLRGTLLLPVATFITHWMLPLFVCLLVERRDLRTLGLTVKRRRLGIYAGYVIVGLALPAFVVGAGRTPAMDLIEQFVQIGVAEEVFFRGYVLHRLVEWLGSRKGLPLGALTFGFAHIVSRFSQHGLEYPLHDLLLGAQTFLGGLLFGLIYLRAKSIVPGATLHVSANLYLERVIEVLGV